MNAAFGGTLIQDLSGHESEAEDGKWASAYRQIDISSGSKLAGIIGTSHSLKVNSRHHQGLKELQKTPVLIVSAHSPEDGYIEGLESPTHEWIIGVQWQPERVGEVPESLQRLFQGFVERSEPFSRR